MQLLQQIPQLKAVIFDLDGTLVDSAPDIQLALNKVLQQVGYQPVAIQKVREWVGRGAPNLIRCAMLDQHIDEARHKEILQLFMQVYLQYVCVDSKLYPYALDLLQAYKQHQLKMAILTNKPQAQAVELLNLLGVAGFFDVIVGGDRLPVRKPSPEPLLYTLQQLGVTAQQAVMVGDSRNDVEASRAAGVFCYVLRGGYNHGEPIEHCQPDEILDSLKDLL